LWNESEEELLTVAGAGVLAAVIGWRSRMAGSLLFKRTSKASNCACWFNSKIQEAHHLKCGASHSITIHFHQKNLQLLRSISIIYLFFKPEPNKEHICYNIENLR
jgi:hypothetical protein